MNFFDRLNNGWTITKSSFSILQKNKQLIIFPLLSGLSLILVIASFVVGLLASAGWDPDYIQTDNTAAVYLGMFGFYVINYFIIVFFNMALVHCTKLYFEGEEVSLAIGLKFSMSRIGQIFSWALFAATVGTILRIIQENTGFVGKLITGIFGIVWGVTTFFVVPIIAYEDLGPIAAFKRSTQLMKEKWGESLSATFSLGLIKLVVFLIAIIPISLVIIYVNPILGVCLAAMTIFVILAVFSAAETIFVSAVYHNIKGDINDHFNQQTIDSLFVTK